MIPARLTSVGRPTLHAIVLSWFLALVADRHAAGKTLLFDLLNAGVVSWEVFLKLLERVTKLGGDCLAAVHATTLPYLLLVVKG